MKTTRLVQKTIKAILMIGQIFLVFVLESCKEGTPTSTTTEAIITTHQGHNLLYDLDGDGKNDYKFSYSFWTTATIPPSTGSGIVVECLDSNQVQNSPITNTKPIKDSVQISDTCGWKLYSGSLASSSNDSPWSGAFVGIAPQNLGVRLNRKGLYYYGWIKLSVTNDGNLTIVNHACQTKSNTPILAGIHP
jgi:hypothetical protein